MIIQTKIHLSQLMVSAAKTCRTPAITHGFVITNGALIRMAEAACNGNIPPTARLASILNELELLGYVNLTTPDSEPKA